MDGSPLLSTGPGAAPRRVERGSGAHGVGGAGVARDGTGRGSGGALSCLRRRLGEESSLGLELDFF
jgi:hypothetical protein